MKMRYYVLSALVLVVGIAAGVLYLTAFKKSTYAMPDDIVMETAFGEEYDFAERPKKARLIEFMYTRCPDICPVTTLEMSKLKKRLEAEGVFGDKVEFMTVTIDPNFDTQEVLRDYAERFEVEPGDGWYFLRGSEEDTQRFASNFDFGYRYENEQLGLITHTSIFYFMDEKENVSEKFTMGEDFDIDRAFERIMRTVN